MVLRFLMRLLGNNEQLISRLAESYPIRRAAQMVVYAFNRTKAVTGDSAQLTTKLKEVREQLEKKLKE